MDHPVPRGWPVAVLLGLAALGAAWAWRPARTLRQAAWPALATGLGTGLWAEHLRVAPGRHVLVAGGAIGTAGAPLAGGASSGAPAAEALVLRDVTVWLPGGARLESARGTLRATATGGQARLTGTLHHPAFELRGCTLAIDEGGDRVTLAADSLRAAPRDVALHARAVHASFRRDGPGAGAWRGRATAGRALVAGIPGADVVAELVVDPDGTWAALPLGGTLAEGACRGHASWRGDTLRLRLELAGGRLEAVPPARLGASSAVQGLCDGHLEAAVGPDATTGTWRLEALGLATADWPALLSVARALQFRLSRELRFDRGVAAGQLNDIGLVFETLALDGETLDLALRGVGSVGWDGLCALPLRATAPRGLLGGVPVVGEVLGAMGDMLRRMSPELREPVTVDLDLGGTLAEPEVTLAGR